MYYRSQQEPNKSAANKSPIKEKDLLELARHHAGELDRITKELLKRNKRGTVKQAHGDQAHGDWWQAADQEHHRNVAAAATGKDLFKFKINDLVFTKVHTADREVDTEIVPATVNP